VAVTAFCWPVYRSTVVKKQRHLIMFSHCFFPRLSPLNSKAQQHRHPSDYCLVWHAVHEWNSLQIMKCHYCDLSITWTPIVSESQSRITFHHLLWFLRDYLLQKCKILLKNLTLHFIWSGASILGTQKEMTNLATWLWRMAETNASNTLHSQAIQTPSNACPAWPDF
jgi:hypothetical protein